MLAAIDPTLRSASLLLVMPAALCTALIAQPSVSASPKSGPPAEKVMVGGTGFRAHEAVDVYFDTIDLALATANSGGAFSGIRLRVPTAAVPGAHWITGIGRQSGIAAQSPMLFGRIGRNFWAARSTMAITLPRTY